MKHIQVHEYWKLLWGVFDVFFFFLHKNTFWVYLNTYIGGHFILVLAATDDLGKKCQIKLDVNIQ